MTVDPIKAPPRRTYFSNNGQNVSGTRDTDAILWLVCHRTISDDHTAEPIARMFRDNGAMGSTTEVLDSDQTQKCMDDDRICQGAAGDDANRRGWHVETCAQQFWGSRFFIRKHRRELQRLAWRLAKKCVKFNIAPEWANAKAVRRGAKGITDHKTITMAFNVSGGHTDTIPAKRYVLRLVKKHVQELSPQKKEKEHGR